MLTFGIILRLRKHRFQSSYVESSPRLKFEEVDQFVIVKTENVYAKLLKLHM